MFSIAVYKRDGKLHTERLLAGAQALSLGTDSANDIVLSDSSSSISPFHAAIYKDVEGTFWLQDLGTRDSIEINGLKKGYWPLMEGDEFVIGGYKCVVKNEFYQKVSVQVVCKLVEEQKTSDAKILLTTYETQEFKKVDEQKSKQVLSELDRCYDSTQDLHKSLELVIKHLCVLLNPERVLIAMCEPKLEMLVNLASYQTNGGDFLFNHSLFHCMLETKKITVGETPIKERGAGTTTSIDANIVRTKYELCVPLYKDDSIMGLLYLERQLKNSSELIHDLTLLYKLSDAISQKIQKDKEPKSKDKEEASYKNKYIWESSMIGISPKIRELLQIIEKYAEQDSKILILGETGTGKNLIAEQIHRNSMRRKAEFIEVNCAAIPADILENELFGHDPEAYTGARNEKKGRFELADGGTLFLNEIGEMPLALQPKLLQAIESKTIWRVGGKEPIEVDVRIIAATNRDIESAVREGTFRLDLYKRLQIISLEAPPLRERKEDIMLLAGYFLFKYRQKYAKRLDRFSAGCADVLCNYGWPGNVRELSATVERAIVNAEGEIIRPDHFELKSDTEPQPFSLPDMEKMHILKVLQYTRGNKTEACKILKISRDTLYKKGQEFNLPGFNEH